MRRWLMLAALVAAGACAVGCVRPPAPSSAPSQPPGPSATSTTGSAAPAPSGSSAAAPSWEKICVVAPTRIRAEWQREVPADEVWSDGEFVVRQVEGDLIARLGGVDHIIFDGDVEDEDAVEPQDVFDGEFFGNERWLVFSSSDSLWFGAPWRLHVADRQHLDQPARVVGEYAGGVEKPGFPFPHLLGDQLVWTEPVADSVFRIQHASLASRTTSTLTEGMVQEGRLVGEGVVLWQAQREGRAIVAEQYDLGTGTITRPDNPIARKDARGGKLITDGEFWLLANVPSGDPDSDETTWDLWAWWPGAADARLVGAFPAPVNVYATFSLHDGTLGLFIPMKGAFVVDLRTGVAQRVHDDWAMLEPGDGVIRASLEGAGPGERIRASLPRAEVAQPGECVGALDD